jgi:hypothetical protein
MDAEIHLLGAKSLQGSVVFSKQQKTQTSAPLVRLEDSASFLGLHRV